MNFNEQIIQELEDTPEFLLEQIVHLIQFIKYKHLYRSQESKGTLPQFPTQEKLETALLSESSLQKDWLTSEEDKAWQHL